MTTALRSQDVPSVASPVIVTLDESWKGPMHMGPFLFDQPEPHTVSIRLAGQDICFAWNATDRTLSVAIGGAGEGKDDALKALLCLPVAEDLTPYRWVGRVQAHASHREARCTFALADPPLVQVRVQLSNETQLRVTAYDDSTAEWRDVVLNVPSQFITP